LARKARKQLYKAAKEINLDSNLLKTLENPKRILKVSIPLKLDNGRTKVSFRCTAYLVAIERIAEVYSFRGVFP
jgi:hypothetical protein